MNRRYAAVPMVVIFLLTACRAASPPVDPSRTPVAERPTRTPPPTATQVLVDDPTPDEATGFQALPLPLDRNEYFAGSGVCVTCHQDMQDDTGADVSIDRMWRSTMMANAARDPYWQAAVRAEAEGNPGLGGVIQDKCANCHMPMAWFTLQARGSEALVLDDGLLEQEQELHEFAKDGVSCTLCHQIQANGLGFPESFSGGFVIDLETPPGERVTFGPYEVEEINSLIMQSASGFIPLQGNHIADSELCASCHTLYTATLDAEGNVVGEFPEQVPYFEWFYSDYRQTQSCQDCHMPEAVGGVRVSNTGDTLRSPFYQHLFVGGNAYMLEVFQTFGRELAATADREDFATTRIRTLEQLQDQTAKISLEEINLSGGRLRFELLVESLVGHKFPSGFPSRRTWIHVLLQDADGQVVYESGGINADGSIQGNDHDVDPTSFEPHYIELVQADQVQIYEAILIDSESEVTTSLMRAAEYAKDNRLLPVGFMFEVPLEEITVKGRAVEDLDFSDGSDRVQYAFDLGDSTGPYSLTVELLYQSIGFRWAENLKAYSAPEVDRFHRLYETVPNQPVVIDSIQVELES